MIILVNILNPPLFVSSGHRRTLHCPSVFCGRMEKICQVRFHATLTKTNWFIDLAHLSDYNWITAFQMVTSLLPLCTCRRPTKSSPVSNVGNTLLLCPHGGFILTYDSLTAGDGQLWVLYLIKEPLHTHTNHLIWVCQSILTTHERFFCSYLFLYALSIVLIIIIIRFNF